MEARRRPQSYDQVVVHRPPRDVDVILRASELQHIYSCCSILLPARSVWLRTE